MSPDLETEEERLVRFRRSIEDMPGTVLARLYPRERACHRAMLQRVKNERATVDPSFRTFVGFLKCMGPMPTPDRSINRIDNTVRFYGPDNVQWATKTEQSNNRSNTRMLRRADGTIWPLTKWAKLTGQKPDTMRKHLNRGWTEDDVIAGKRDRRAPDTPTTDTEVASRWPSRIADSAEKWEKAWTPWAKRFLPGWKPTRDVFYLWVASNVLRKIHDQLSRQFPDEFGENADPAGRVSASLMQNERFKVFREASPTVTAMRINITSGTAEHATLKSLIEMYPDTINFTAAGKKLPPPHDSND